MLHENFGGNVADKLFKLGLCTLATEMHLMISVFLRGNMFSFRFVKTTLKKTFLIHMRCILIFYTITFALQRRLKHKLTRSIKQKRDDKGQSTTSQCVCVCVCVSHDVRFAIFMYREVKRSVHYTDELLALK